MTLIKNTGFTGDFVTEIEIPEIPKSAKSPQISLNTRDGYPNRRQMTPGCGKSDETYTNSGFVFDFGTEDEIPEIPKLLETSFYTRPRDPNRRKMTSGCGKSDVTYFSTGNTGDFGTEIEIPQIPKSPQISFHTRPGDPGRRQMTPGCGKSDQTYTSTGLSLISVRKPKFRKYRNCQKFRSTLELVKPIDIK